MPLLVDKIWNDVLYIIPRVYSHIARIGKGHGAETAAGQSYSSPKRLYNLSPRQEHASIYLGAVIYKPRDTRIYTGSSVR